MKTFTVFYMVPGQYTSSTAVLAYDKTLAAKQVHLIRAGGKAVVTSVMRGE